MRRSGLLLLCLVIATSLSSILPAQQMDLSSDDPISYDAGTGALVARGNARFEHQQVLVEADEIRYDEKARTIRATGNVRVTQEGIRLVTRNLTYNIDTKEIESGPFRAGYPPLFIEGESFGGTLGDLVLEEGRVHFREPEALTPTVTFDEATVRDQSRIEAEGVGLDLPLIGGIPLPRLSHDGGATPEIRFDGTMGYRDNLGAYARSEILLPVDDNWVLGGNFDLYTGRGVLLGPSIQYTAEDPEDKRLVRFELSSGWIADQGEERGRDLFGDRIDHQRGFAEAELRYVQSNFEALAVTSFRSDSEVMRDFRPGRYRHNPSPDSFLELTQLWDDRFLSIFIRRTPNEYYGLTERLPEIRLDQPIRPLGETGLHHGGDVSYQRYRRTYAFGAGSIYPPRSIFGDDDISDGFGRMPIDPNVRLRAGYFTADYVQRFDANYVIEGGFEVVSGVQFTPRAGVRYTRWEVDGADNPSRLATEFGFDLTAQGFRDWDYQNKTWGIDGLRHLIRPFLAYRLQPSEFSGDESVVPAYEMRPYSPLLPALDLRDRRDGDAIRDRHFVRLGIEQRLLTRDTKQGTRTLAELDIYQDLVLDLRDGLEDAHATYWEMRAQPASWLEFAIAQKYLTDEFSLEETRLRATIQSADQWQVSLSFDFLENVYDQYRLEGWYRLNSRFVLIGGIRYDAEREELTRQSYGLRHRISRSWELEYGVEFRKGAEREDNFSLFLGLNLVEF
jgi:lipopolysaccharide export system protein LptA